MGFRTWVNAILRLRGIDAPEMSSTAGRAAAMFVKEALGVRRTERPQKIDGKLSAALITHKEKTGIMCVVKTYKDA